MLHRVLFAALPAVLAAADAVTPVTRRQAIEIRDPVIELSALSRSDLWVTADGGRSWRHYDSQSVADAAVEPPQFRFAPDQDGTYGFALVRAWRDGRQDAPPTPGLPLDPASQITIDRTPPSIDQWSAEAQSSDPLGIRVAVRWAVSDPNPGPDPVTIELGQPGSDSWTTLATVPATGASELMVPAGGSLRLSVVDSVGNRGTSTTWTAPVNEADGDLESAIGALPALDTNTADSATEATPDSATTTTTAANASDPVSEAETTESAPAEASDSSDLIDAEPTEAAGPPPLPSDINPELLVILAEARARRDQQVSRRSRDPNAADPSLVLAELPPGLLLAPLSDDALTAARTASTAGDLSNARALYVRLLDSDRASDAWPEMLDLLRRHQRLDRAASQLAQVPPEAAGDKLSLAIARIELERERGFSAEAALVGIATDSAYQREAQLLAAQALLIQPGRSAQGLAILRHLSRDMDAIGRAAWALLERY